MPTELLGKLPRMEEGGSHFILRGPQRLLARALPWEPWDCRGGGLPEEGHPVSIACLRLCTRGGRGGWPVPIQGSLREGGGGGRWLSSAPRAVRPHLSGCSQFPDGMGCVGMTGVWTKRLAEGPLRCGGAVLPCRGSVGSYYKAQILRVFTQVSALIPTSKGSPTGLDFPH